MGQSGAADDGVGRSARKLAQVASAPASSRRIHYAMPSSAMPSPDPGCCRNQVIRGAPALTHFACTRFEFKQDEPRDIGEALSG
eukprot:315602-Rhodomonas_salina.2